jgi:hypothetical protein
MTVTVFLIALAHAVPIFIFRAVTNSKNALTIAAVVMAVVAIAVGNIAYAGYDLAAVGLAYFICYRGIRSADASTSSPAVAANAPKISRAALTIAAVIVAIIIGKVIGRVGSDVVLAPKASSVSVTRAAFSLEQVAREVNKRLPMTIDAETRLDTSVAGPGLQYTYIYTLVNYPATSIDGHVLQESFGPSVKRSACANKDMAVFFRNNVTVSYDYRGNDGRPIATIKVLPADCNDATHIEHVAPGVPARNPRPQTRQQHSPPREDRSLCNAGFTQACKPL